MTNLDDNVDGLVPVVDSDVSRCQRTKPVGHGSSGPFDIMRTHSVRAIPGVDYFTVIYPTLCAV